jgi:hypothetical protein
MAEARYNAERKAQYSVLCGATIAGLMRNAQTEQDSTVYVAGRGVLADLEYEQNGQMPVKVV